MALGENETIVYEDGRLYVETVIKSRRESELNELQGYVEEAQNAVNEVTTRKQQKLDELEQLEAELGAKERALDSCKSGLATAQTLVGEPSDNGDGGAVDGSTDGVGGEATDGVADAIHVPVLEGV